MTSEILDINEATIIDESIESYQFVEQLPEAGEANINTPGTEINITFNNSSNFILPSESYLRIEGQFNTGAGAAWASTANGSAIAFVNNGILNLFSNFKYELADTIIEYFENAGLTTTTHNYLTKSRTYQGLDWFWKPDELTPATTTNNISFLTRNNLTYATDPGVWYFSACVPLRVIFNFCNDYTKVMWGLKQRIRMTRATSTRALVRVNAAIAANGVLTPVAGLTAVAADAVINLTTLRWVMPVVRPSPMNEQTLLSIVGNSGQFIDVTFLNKRTNSITVPQATTFTWPLATTSGVERPRYIVIIFQVGTYTDQTFNSSAFSSNPNVLGAYITLSGVKYPSIDMNTDTTLNRYTKWYREYKRFFNKYNQNNRGEPCLSYTDFIRIAPMYIFDVSNQTENLKRAAVDATLFMTFGAAVVANTTAYSIIYFDSRYEVSSTQIRPLTQIL